MTAKKTFREVLAARRDFEINSGERLTDIGGNKHRPMDTKQLVKHLVSTELSSLGEEAGYETFEEADDFEDEDPEPLWASAYEIHPMEEDHEMEQVPQSEPRDDDSGRTDPVDDNGLSDLESTPD